MVDPFMTDNQTDLVNISTGVRNESTDLLHVRSLGVEAMIAAEGWQGKVIPPKVVTFAEQKKAKPSNEKVLTKVYREESSVTRTLCFLQGADETTQANAFSHEWT